MKETEIEKNIYKVSQKADVDSSFFFFFLFIDIENGQCVEIWSQHIHISSWIQELGPVRSMFALLREVLGTKYFIDPYPFSFILLILY